MPTLDGVAFIDPRRSEVDIVQAVGRAIRKSDDKTVGTIVIPVFIDTDDRPRDRARRLGVQAGVGRDQGAPRPRRGARRAARRPAPSSGPKRAARRLPDKIHVDVPAKVGTDFARAFDVRLVEQTTGLGILVRVLERLRRETRARARSAGVHRGRLPPRRIGP